MPTAPIRYQPTALPPNHKHRSGNRAAGRRKAAFRTLGKERAKALDRSAIAHSAPKSPYPNQRALALSFPADRAEGMATTGIWSDHCCGCNCGCICTGGWSTAAGCPAGRTSTPGTKKDTDAPTTEITAARMLALEPFSRNTTPQV